MGRSLFRSSIADLIPYEPGKPIEEVQRELGLERVVKLASNEGPFPPFPAAADALERATRDLNRYPDGGAYALRSAIAGHHDVEPALTAMRQVGESLRKDAVFGPSILADMEIWGVERWELWGLSLRGRIKVLPREKDTVRREFLKRLVGAFEANGIKTP